MWAASGEINLFDIDIVNKAVGNMRYSSLQACRGLIWFDKCLCWIISLTETHLLDDFKSFKSNLAIWLVQLWLVCFGCLWRYVVQSYGVKKVKNIALCQLFNRASFLIYASSALYVYWNSTWMIWWDWIWISLTYIMIGCYDKLHGGTL